MPLQTQNSIDRLLGALLENIARNKPGKPVQWMIDVLSSSSSVEQAVQAASQARITYTPYLLFVVLNS